MTQMATTTEFFERLNGPWHKRARIALLSNPKSTGNIAQLPRIREYCDSHPDVFHYEVEEAGQIGEAILAFQEFHARRQGRLRT